jgi:LPXTG-motif cell wall-anchored protein
MDAQSTVKLIAGILLILVIGVLFLRRKGKGGKTKGDDDDF